VAPALLPKQAGDRVNTHRRDARPLARLLRSGDLTPVSVPPVEDDALRARRRARDDARRDVKTAQPRLNAFRRRHDLRDTGRATWGPAPWRGRSEVVWATPAQPIVLQASVRAVSEHPARLQRRAPDLHAQGPTWRLPPVVEALPGRRGGQGTVAGTRGAELGDLGRCDTPSQLRRSLGLTPSAYAPGDPRHQGAITKRGNAHARRARLEGAWASRSPANVSRQRHWRLENRPKPLQDSSWKAPGRRCPRDRPRLARGQHGHRVVVAIARELRACLGARAPQMAVTP
jgi:transposase